MAKIKYDMDVMKFFSLFESLTGAKLKDCIFNGSILFIVNEGEIGKAIGKNGSNVKRIIGLLKKNIKIVEFSPDVVQFIANLIYPLKPTEIKNEDGIVNVICPDMKTRGLLIGRDRVHINFVSDVVKRFFDVREIKVS